MDELKSKLDRFTISAAHSSRRSILCYRAEIIALGLLLVMGAVLLSLGARESVTNDEIVHIPAGYNYLVSGEFRLNTEHPPLVKMWACLPLLLIRPEKSSTPNDDNQDFAQHTVSYSVAFWRANQNRFESIAFCSRVPIVLITLLLGASIFIFGRQLFGPRAAVLSVALFVLEPTMLAHGWIVQTDIAAALGYLLFFVMLRAYYLAPTTSRAIWFGGATGVALLVKFSMVIVVPVFLAVFIYELWDGPQREISRRRIAMNFCVAAGIPLLAINAIYYFQHPLLAQNDVNWIAGSLHLVSERLLFLIGNLSRILPTYYVFGLYTVLVHNQSGHPAGLLGDYSSNGWWYYFPVAFALKTSLPFLLLSLATLCWALWSGISKKDKRLIGLLFAGGLYLAVSMTSHINIGIRHVAPIFPFLFLLGGAFLDRICKAKMQPGIAPLITVLVFAWMFTDALRTYPHYLSFTSPMTMGKPGWAVLSDSNVEWGQDVGALAQYLHARGETKVLWALSAGWATAQLYDIQLLDFAPRDLTAAGPRYVAIGAGFLNGSTMPGVMRDDTGELLTEEQRRNYFAWYRTAQPEAIFGNSIYLYRRKD